MYGEGNFPPDAREKKRAGEISRRVIGIGLQLEKGSYLRGT